MLQSLFASFLNLTFDCTLFPAVEVCYAMRYFWNGTLTC